MDICQIAQEMRPVVYQAGEIAKRYFSNVIAERKADRSMVTVADREVELFLKQEIEQRFPEHGVLGEEFGHHQLDNSDYIWVLDPIDGTAPFVYELPVWCISVGLLYKKKPVLGFVYLPVVDELYWAYEGSHAHVNDRIINVAEPCEMDRATCIVAPSATVRGFSMQYKGRVLSFGSAAAHMCYVARGNLHGGILMQVRIWDIAASAAIINAAGGEMRYLGDGEIEFGQLIDGRKMEPFLIGHSHNVDKLAGLLVSKA